MQLESDTLDTHHLAAQISTSSAHVDTGKLTPGELRQWLDFWDDADSVQGNLRRVSHWMNRVRHSQATDEAQPLTR